MWPHRDPGEERLCFHDDASLVQEVHWPGVPARAPDLSSMSHPRRPAALQHRSWTQSSTPGWGLVLRALSRQDAARCGQGEHTGHCREAGGAERQELHGTPLPRGSGWPQLGGAPEHSRHVHTPVHLTHTCARTYHAHADASACTHTCAYTCTQACTHACTRGYAHTSMHTCVYAHTCMGTHTALHPLHPHYPDGPRHAGLPVSTPGDAASSAHPRPTLSSQSHFSCPWDSTDLASVGLQDDLLSLSRPPCCTGQDRGPQMDPGLAGTLPESAHNSLWAPFIRMQPRSLLTSWRCTLWVL